MASVGGLDLWCLGSAQSWTRVSTLSAIYESFHGHYPKVDICRVIIPVNIHHCASRTSIMIMIVLGE